MCQDQEHRNKMNGINLRNSAFKLFLFSHQWNTEHKALLRADYHVMTCFFFPPLLSLRYYFFLFIISPLAKQENRSLNVTKIHVFMAPLSTLEGWTLGLQMWRDGVIYTGLHWGRPRTRILCLPSPSALPIWALPSSCLQSRGISLIFPSKKSRVTSI